MTSRHAMYMRDYRKQRAAVKAQRGGYTAMGFKPRAYRDHYQRHVVDMLVAARQGDAVAQVMLRLLMEALDEPERQIIHKRVFNGLSVSQCAKEMYYCIGGISERQRSAIAHMAYALKALE